MTATDSIASARRADRPRIDARTTAWLIAQRERNRELELELARLEGQVETAAAVERGVQRYADKLETRLEEGRRREATLARAVGYLESRCDELEQRLRLALAERTEPAREEPPPALPRTRRRFGKRTRRAR